MQQLEIFSGMMRGFRNRIVLFILLVTVGVIGSIVFAVNQPRAFRTFAAIQIESPQVADGSGIGVATSSSAAHRLQLIEQRLMARDNILSLIEKHSLFEADTPFSMTEQADLVRGSIDISQIMPGAAVGAAALTQVPSGLTIQVEWDDPNKAADMANDLVALVIEQNAQRREVQARETLSFFATEEERLRLEINALEEELAEYKQVNQFLLPEAVGSLIEQEGLFQENLLEIDQQIVMLRSDAARQRQDYVVQQVAILQEQKALLSERLVGVRAQLRRAPEIEKELAGMNRTLAQFQAQYDVVTTNRAEAELSMSLESRKQAERFEILDPAVPPIYPVSLSRRAVIALGAVMSAFAAAALLFVIENANSVIRNASQLKEELDLTPVVSIPEVVSRREAFGERLVMASSLALLFIIVPLIALQFAGT